MTLDENDLRAGLHALTAAPPPAPAERAAGSVRRLRTMRRRRTGLAVVTAFAVTLPLFAVVTRDDAGPPVPTVPLATALLQWPTRYGEGGEEFARQATTTAGVFYNDERGVRVLYAGQVGEFMVAALARCGADACTDVSLVSSRPGSRPEFIDGNSQPFGKEQPIGWYFPAAEGSTLFVLGPPEARHLRGNGIDVTNGEGVFVTGIGWRTSFLDLRVEDAKSRTLVSGRPGLPGGEDPRPGVPYAEPLTSQARVPDGYRAGPVYNGQSGTSGSNAYDAFPEKGMTGPFQVFVVCVGTVEEVLVMTFTQETATRVRCDGQVHPGPLDDLARPGPGFDVESRDPFTRYSVAVGYPED